MKPEGINGGYFCLISPARKAQPGDRVWIRDFQGATAIKRLVGLDDKCLVLQGWQPVRDGEQKDFEDHRFLDGIKEYHPVVAVYKGKPGGDNVEFVPDPRHPVASEAPAGQLADDMIHIHLHDAQFSAGSGAYAEDGVISSIGFPAPWLQRMGLTQQSASLVLISGESMEPTLKSGAMAMLDTRQTDVKKRRIYAFRFEEDLFVKRLEWIGGQLLAQSDNKEYDTMLLSQADLEQVQIFGEVVWSGHQVAI